MSTQTAQYIFLGHKVPFESGTYETYENYHDNIYKEPRKGLTVLYDGRDGKYILIGTILERSDCDYSLEGLVDLTALQDKAAVLSGVLSDLIKVTFGIEKPDVRLWFVTAYH